MITAAGGGASVKTVSDADMMKAFFLCLCALVISGPSYADHLKELPPEKALSFHKFRVAGLPSRYKQIPIARAQTPFELTVAAETNPAVEEMLGASDLLSVMQYDQGVIVLDAVSAKIRKDDKLYSMSMSKSLIGYLVGHAVCENHIASLDDPVSRYIPETVQSIYRDAKVGDMISMAAGDQPIWSPEGYNAREYSALVIHGNPEKRQAIRDVLSSRPNVQPANVGAFRYSNAITDIVARLLDIATPDGLGNFAQKHLAEAAGNRNDMFILADENGWPLAHAFLYATRDDFMRMAIKINNDWQSEGCIGDFLRQQQARSIPTNRDGQTYAAFFWMKDANTPSPRIILNGHGGQRIILKPAEDTVVSYHAIRSNFDQTMLEAALQ